MNKNRYLKKIFLVAMVVLIILSGFFLFFNKKKDKVNKIGFVKGSQTSLFKSNQQRYFNYCNSQEAISKAGTKEERGKCTWAWLKNGRIDLVEQDLKKYYFKSESDGPWWYIGTGYKSAQVMYFWVKAKDKLSEELISLFRNRVRDFHEQSINKNPNQAFQIMAAEYLYAENFDRNLEYKCKAANKWCQFSYDGRDYLAGQTYNSYQLTKDFLEKEINDLVKQKKYSRISSEIDSPSYTWSFVNGLLMLHETTNDAQLKNKARMALDMLFLDTGTQCVFKIIRHYNAAADAVVTQCG